MEKIKQIEIMAHDLIKYYCPEYSFKWCSAKRRYGSCSYHKKRITISKVLTNLNNVESTLDTVLHEIAHALAPKENHGKVWIETAKAIGCNGERLYDSTKVNTPLPSMMGTCPSCLKTIKRFRAIKLSCSACGLGKFNANYLFQWKKV